MELNKFNIQIYTLTFGPQTIPPMAQKISNKMMCLNYKYYKRSLCENGGMSLHIIMVVKQCPTVADIMASPLDDYINIAAKNCGYGGTTEELIINYVHQLFLKAKPDTS